MKAFFFSSGLEFSLEELKPSLLSSARRSSGSRIFLRGIETLLRKLVFLFHKSRIFLRGIETISFIEPSWAWRLEFSLEELKPIHQPGYNYPASLEFSLEELKLLQQTLIFYPVCLEFSLEELKQNDPRMSSARSSLEFSLEELKHFTSIP